MTKVTKRQKEDQNVWNFFFSLFFVGALVFCLYVLYSVHGQFPSSITFLDVALLSFAAFRITRLVVYDKITRFFREWFVSKKEVEENGVVWVELMPLPSGFRRTLHDLLQCPWCVGLWAGLIASFCYFIFAWAWFVILFLAVSGLGSLLQLFANYIGWYGENLKLDANKKEREGSTSDRSGL